MTALKSTQSKLRKVYKPFLDKRDVINLLGELPLKEIFIVIE